MRKSLVFFFLILLAFSLWACGKRQTVTDSSSLSRDFSFTLPLFSASSAWNQNVSGLTKLAQSDAQILVTYRVLRGDITDLVPYTSPPTTWPFMDVVYDDFSIPIFKAGSAKENVLIRDYAGNLGFLNSKWTISQAGGPVSVVAPAGMVRPAGPQNTDADGHLILFDSTNSREYDFWQATTLKNQGGGQTGEKILEAGFIDFFDIMSSGTNYPNADYSARATGVALLAGLILPEDVASGAISHALAFAIPGPRQNIVFYPAAVTETDFYSTNTNALASGQRIRLKKSIVDEEGNTIDETQLAPITQMFLTALRNYGAILVDNAGGFTFYAEDRHTANLNLTDQEVNNLIGKSAQAALPSNKTKWQIVMEALNLDLEQIPIAYGSWQEGNDPKTATVTTSNFEVIPSATIP